MRRRGRHVPGGDLLTLWLVGLGLRCQCLSLKVVVVSSTTAIVVVFGLFLKWQPSMVVSKRVVMSNGMGGAGRRGRVVAWNV